MREGWVSDRFLARDCHDDLNVAILDLLVAGATLEHSKGLHLLADHRQNHGTRLPAPVLICDWVAKNYAGMELAVTIEERQVQDVDSGSLLEQRKYAEPVKLIEFVVLAGLEDIANSWKDW